MADLNEIIAGAMGESQGGDEDESSVEVQEPEVTIEAAVEEPAADVEKAKTPEPDEIAKLLEEHGVQRGKGVRENLFKYTKVRKILDNQKKKLSDAHTVELTRTQGENQALRQQMEAFQRADQLAGSDADRYMELLSTIHPQYKRFLQNPASAVEKPKQEAAPDLSDMPKPDSPDGYTDEGLKKLMAWSAKQAEASLLPKFREELDKRFKPIDDGKKAYELRQQTAGQIQGQVRAARERWGALLDTNEAAILKILETDPKISFEGAVETVLIPLLLADKSKIRGEVLEELKASKKAASASGGTSTASAEPNRPRSTEDIIKDTLAAIPR